jgi:hypothetical protein
LLNQKSDALEGADVSSSTSQKAAVALILLAGGFLQQLCGLAGGEIGDNPSSAVPRQSSVLPDWPTPQAVFVFSGQQHGYLEPCGCSPEFQKGGLARRFTFIKTLQQKKWPVVTADLGGLLDDPARQPAPGRYVDTPEHAKIKLEISLEALHQMKYESLNLAPEDLAALDGFLGLVGQIGNLENTKLRPLNANFVVEPIFIKEGLLFRYVIPAGGGLKIAIIGMLGEKYKDRVADQDLKEWQPPAKVLGKALSEVKPQSDLQVLMLYGSLDEAKRLAESFPDLDVVVYALESEEPPSEPVWTDNKKTMLVTVGTKGKNAAAVGIFKGEPRLRFALVPLDGRFEEDKGIRELLDKIYIDRLKQAQLVQKYPKVPHEKDNPSRGFVGSKKCGECHLEVYKFWQTTRHAHALETLVNGYEDPKTRKRIAPGKQENPDCVSCHTTGFFHRTGYDGTDATKHLGGNGCENCHGPGSEHVRIISKLDYDAEELRAAKKMMHLPLQTETNNACSRCHDFENSPKFKLADYWEKVEHGAQAAEDKENWPTIREKLRQGK